MVGDDDGSDDLTEILVALRERLQVWADAGEPTELDAVLPIRHLFKLGMDAIDAEHGLKEGTAGFEELP